MKRFLAAVAEFLYWRDWLPEFPWPTKCHGHGCMSLYDAIRGFPED